MGYFVPKTLKQMNNWVVWTSAKVPYSPKKCSQRTQAAKASDRRTWGSYEEAMICRENDDRFKGIGFEFMQGEGLIFIDIDHCINEDGSETEFATEVQALFPNTYTEISQSETGIHIVCKGELPKGTKNRKRIGTDAIEIYSGGQYMAFTGNAICLVEPSDAQTGINALIEKCGLLGASEAETGVLYNTPCDESADDLIRVIKHSKKGDLFRHLMDGEWNIYQVTTDCNGCGKCLTKCKQNAIMIHGGKAVIDVGLCDGCGECSVVNCKEICQKYGSQSEADMAFMSIVNFYASGNDALTMALWQRSKLSDREKGQRLDYIRRTLQRAKKGLADATRAATLVPFRPDALAGVKDQPQRMRRRRF